MFGDVSIDRCAFRRDPGGQATGEADEVDADRRAEVDSRDLDAAFDTVIEDREVQIALLAGVRGRGRREQAQAGDHEGDDEQGEVRWARSEFQTGEATGPTVEAPSVSRRGHPEPDAPTGHELPPGANTVAARSSTI